MPSSTTAVGVSSFASTAMNDRFLNDGLKTMRQVHGAMTRLGFGERTSLLAEADVMYLSRHDIGYVGFAQFDHEPIRGLHFFLTGEVLDRGRSKAADAPAAAPGIGEPQLGVWLSSQWFIVSHFDIRVDAIFRQQADPQILAQLHLYL